jgi:transposase
MTALSQDGAVVARRKVPSNREAIQSALRELGDGPLVAAFEASGSWYWVADALEELPNVEAKLANPHKTRVIAEAQMKTDEVDAMALAQLLRMGWLPESRLISRDKRSVRDRMRCRIRLVQLRTALKNQVHGILIKHGVENAFSDLFGVKGLEWLRELALPGFYGEDRDALLRLIKRIDEEVALIDKWITKTVRATRDAEMLTTIPGIGKIGALILLSEIGDINYFKSPRKLSAYAGLAQGIYQSGEKTIIRGLRTDSNKYIRWICVEAVTKAVRVVPGWKRLYDSICRMDKSKKPKARAAVAHKIIKAAWRVLATKEPFDHLAGERKNPAGQLDKGVWSETRPRV